MGAVATVINTGGGQARDCFLALPAGLDADFTFQITNPATNEPRGNVNAPSEIPANGSQSFLFIITPNSAIAPTVVIIPAQAGIHENSHCRRVSGSRPAPG